MSATSKAKFPVPGAVKRDEKQLEKFIEGAGKPLEEALASAPAPEAPAQAFPWDALDDVKRHSGNAFNVRQTEKEKAILKHLAESTPYSMHEIMAGVTRKFLLEAEEKLKRGEPIQI